MENNYNNISSDSLALSRWPQTKIECADDKADTESAVPMEGAGGDVLVGLGHLVPLDVLQDQASTAAPCWKTVSLTKLVSSARLARLALLAYLALQLGKLVF